FGRCGLGGRRGWSPLSSAQLFRADQETGSTADRVSPLSHFGARSRARAGYEAVLVGSSANGGNGLRARQDLRLPLVPGGRRGRSPGAWLDRVLAKKLPDAPPGLRCPGAS